MTPGSGGGGGVGADGTVRAAGGVVWRRAPGGGTEVLLVHRPKYDDWSLPKGKLGPDEGDTDGALREVEEETGLRCTLGPELATSYYTDSLGRPKVVRYWAMAPQGGEFRPNREVDRCRWLPLGEAVSLLSYDRDREILASAHLGTDD
ncbi:MAG: NUDIX hydrolase [Acidimicrobiales bacterium]